MKKTKHFSWRKGLLTKGCQQCVRGEKTVLFITGICNNNCYYCPISDKKKAHDDVYANEWKIKSIKDLIEEIKLCKSKGVGITGGDPLLKVDRCLQYIKILKKKFGKKFHIHLYTPLKNVSDDKLSKLSKAGLDEIRFHPNLDNPSEWKRIELALNYEWKKGVEIPAIPLKLNEAIELVKYLNGKIDFLNLNELEVADNRFSKLTEKGYKTKDDLSYAVRGSQKTAFKIAQHAEMPVHYCTATLKDRVQLMNRIKRRAQGVAKKFDVVTENGTILRGAVYLDELKPGFGYHDKIDHANRKALIKKLERLRKEIIREDGIKPQNLIVDEVKLRLITGVKDVRLINHPNKAIVEEMPTQDALEMEVEFL